MVAPEELSVAVSVSVSVSVAVEENSALRGRNSYSEGEEGEAVS